MEEIIGELLDEEIQENPDGFPSSDEGEDTVTFISDVPSPKSELEIKVDEHEKKLDEILSILPRMYSNN